MAAMTKQQMLTDAEYAYHQLNTGQLARVFVDQNGERVEFTVTNKASLYSYIQTLKGELGVLTGVSDGFNRPMRFIF